MMGGCVVDVCFFSKHTWKYFEVWIVAGTPFPAGHNCSGAAPCRVAICTAIYLEDPYLVEWCGPAIWMWK